MAYLFGGRHVATMTVEWFPGATLTFDTSIPQQQIVPEGNLLFRVKIEYVSRYHGIIGVRYQARLKRLSQSSPDLTEVAFQERWLFTQDGLPQSQFIELGATMVDAIEDYVLELDCYTAGVFMGRAFWDATSSFHCIFLPPKLDFSLDYIPLSIVYCPPEQDMTNSVGHRVDFGTQITVGNTSAAQATTGQGAHLNTGILSTDIGAQESQSSSNTAQSGLSISYFRNTIITADNQRAIGRAYWGPLGDLFVLMVNAHFNGTQAPSGATLYGLIGCDDIAVIPAHKLLRPANDEVATSVPADTRRKLLELDPFIKRDSLDLFFPADTGADLSLAINPYADPTVDDRAELIGVWRLSPGVAVTYGIGEDIQILSRTGSEIKWSTTISGAGSVILGGQTGNTTEVGIQWTQEMRTGISRSASCSLIRNQNSAIFDIIKLYYDKNFGSIMFRRVRSRPRPGLPVGSDLVHEIPDVSQDLIWSVLCERYPQLCASLPQPLPAIDLAKPDFGLGRLLSGVPEGELATVVEQLLLVLVPDKSVVGRVLDGTNAPIFSEEVSLTRGGRVVYRTYTDGQGRFRFDNVVIGRYDLVVGDAKRAIDVQDVHSFDRPVAIEITDARRPLDLAVAPRWKIENYLGIPKVALAKHGKKLLAARSLDELAKLLSLTKDQEASMRARLFVRAQVLDRGNTDER
jgi:hypothetical protein